MQRRVNENPNIEILFEELRPKDCSEKTEWKEYIWLTAKTTVQDRALRFTHRRIFPCHWTQTQYRYIQTFHYPR